MRLRNLTAVLLLALTSFFTGAPYGDAALYPETCVRGQNFQTTNFVKAINPLAAESHQVKQQFSYELTVDSPLAPKKLGPGTGIGPGAKKAGSAFDQTKRISKGEIKKLKQQGFDIHDLKGGKNASKFDIFKDQQGNLSVKPKSGKGPGDPLGININNP